MKNVPQKKKNLHLLAIITGASPEATDQSHETCINGVHTLHAANNLPMVTAVGMYTLPQWLEIWPRMLPKTLLIDLTHAGSCACTG